MSYLRAALMWAAVFCVWHPAAFGQSDPTTGTRAPSPMTARLEGHVRDAATGLPLPGAHIRLVGTTYGAVSDADGRYRLAGVPPGRYTAEVSLLGFGTRQGHAWLLAPGASASVHFDLTETPLPLREVVVTPGRFSMHRAVAGSVQSLGAEELARMPNLGDDVYRAVRRMPGLSGSDYSARFNVRGGEHEEVLVTLDGLELQEPFHLKDIGGGALSIVDVEAVRGVELMTGAFTAEYGNRLSAVFALSSIEPEEGKTSASISLMNARLASQSTFQDGRGRWLALGRRGYVDLLLQLTGQRQDYAPRYFDGFFKTSYRIGRGHTFSLQALGSLDNLVFIERDEPADRALTAYRNGYLWAYWRSTWSRRLYSETVLSRSSSAQERYGIDVRRSDGWTTFEVDDLRTSRAHAAKQDWHFEAGDRSLLKWGWYLRRHRAAFDYTSTDYLEEVSTRAQGPKYDVTTRVFDRAGYATGGYGAYRQRLGPALTVETGLRLDAADWTHDRQLSPRLNAGYTLGEKTTLMAGWGLFQQIQGLHELMLPDGDTDFYPAERAEHRVIGLYRALAGDASLRLDLYDKRKSRLRPRYASLVGDATNLFPEVADDRVRLQPTAGRARGMEAVAEKRFGRRMDAWVSYALSYVDDTIDGLHIPKSFDQRHTVFADLNIRLGERTGINIAWQYHSGWRYTSVDVELVRIKGVPSFYRKHFGPMNGEILPAYHRLDIRVQRDFSLGASVLASFIEVRNAYNRRNIRLYNYQPINQKDGSVVLIPEPHTWLPILPAFGLQWEFGHRERIRD